MRKMMFVAAVMVLAATGCTCGKIEPGHVGVVVPLSGDEKGTLDTTSNGWYMYSFNTQVFEFPVYNQQHNWSSSSEKDVRERLYFGDKNGLRLGADVGIEFNVPADKVATLFKTYRQDLDKIRGTVLKMSVQNALNLTAQSYTAEDIFGEKRGEFFSKVHQQVHEQMSPNGIEVVSLYLNGELELPQQIRETIQAKLQATMFAQQKTNEKEAVIAEMAKVEAQAAGEAKAAKERAAGEANARIEQARGNAESQRLQAEARAAAILAEAKAQAEANAKIGASLTAGVLELRKLEIQAEIQKAYAAKWEGQVPTTILPQQAGGYMMDMRGMTLSK